MTPASRVSISHSNAPRAVRPDDPSVPGIRQPALTGRVHTLSGYKPFPTAPCFSCSSSKPHVFQSRSGFRRFSIVGEPRSQNEGCSFRAKERTEGTLPSKSLEEGTIPILAHVRNSPTPRRRNDGAARPIGEGTESGFLVIGSRRVDPWACPSLVPDESDPRGSSAHTRPSNVSDVAH
jgi:hypothetical protein